jgi:hypothetical protein
MMASKQVLNGVTASAQESDQSQVDKMVLSS